MTNSVLNFIKGLLALALLIGIPYLLSVLGGA